MAKMKQKNDPIFNQPRTMSELMATDIEEQKTDINEYVHSVLEEASGEKEDTQEAEKNGALKLVPGETLLKTMEGLVSGQPQIIKIYYGNYVTVNGNYRPFKSDVYEKTLEDFLTSEEGSGYERPSKEGNEAAVAEVKRVMDAYQKKQELIRSSNILQPGRSLLAPETKTEAPLEEEKPEEQQTFTDDPPSEEAKGIEFIRNKNYSKQFIDEARKEFHSEKRRSIFGMVVITLISTAVLVLAIFLIKDIVVKMHALIELELKANEITIRAGDAFSPSDYIRYVTEDESIYVIYPSLDTKDVGIHRLDYVATNGIKNVKKTLKVFVIDGESPVITLTSEEITLVRNRDEESFDPLNYVKEVHDNLDQNLDIEVNELNWSKDEQSLTYRVKDSSGNSGKAILLVKIEDKMICDKNAIYNSTTNTCRCKSGYEGDGTACKLVYSNQPSSDASSDSGSSNSSGSSGNGGSMTSSSSWSESWTADYTDYQPSNGQTDVTYTNNDTGESYTVHDSDVGPYESDEDLWNEIDNLP